MAQPKETFDPTSKEQQVALPPLLDKESWHTRLRAEVEEAQAAGRPLSVIFIDINYFKDINDTLGHLVGDRTIDDLKEVVSLITANLRTQSDVVFERQTDFVSLGSSETPWSKQDEARELEAGHIGGDEFALICKTDEDGTKAVITRLRQTFADYLDRPENQRLRELGIGMAVGAGLLKPGMSREDLLKQADEAMYEDKINQLPNLNEKQRRALLIARYILEAENIRLRDAPKYWDLPA